MDSTKKKTKPMPIKMKTTAGKLTTASSSSSNASPQASTSSSISSSSGSSSNDSPPTTIQPFVSDKIKQKSNASSASATPILCQSKSGNTRIGFGAPFLTNASGQVTKSLPVTPKLQTTASILGTSIFASAKNTRTTASGGTVGGGGISSNTITKIASATFSASNFCDSSNNSSNYCTSSTTTISGNSNINIPSDILDDLASRFIINVPDDERNNLIRICFQIELAHWFYLDFFCANSDKKLTACGMKQFAMFLFKHIPFLKVHLPAVDKILEDWKQYKLTVPTYGAILLSEDLAHVLLVQSYWAKSSWGFPKGKVNENENPIHCAAREVFEETGYDITHLIQQSDYIESVINDQHTRLYIVRNVPLKTHFAPRTRKEIKCCEWFPIDSLPTCKNDTNTKQNLGINANSFFMIMPFIKRLKKWIQERRLSGNENLNHKAKSNNWQLMNSGNNYSPQLKKTDPKLSFNLSSLTTIPASDRFLSSSVKRQRHKSMGDIDGMMKVNTSVVGRFPSAATTATTFDSDQMRFYQRDKNFKGKKLQQQSVPINSGKLTTITTNLLIESSETTTTALNYTKTTPRSDIVPTSSIAISSYHYDCVSDDSGIPENHHSRNIMDSPYFANNVKSFFGGYFNQKSTITGSNASSSYTGPDTLHSNENRIEQKPILIASSASPKMDGTMSTILNTKPSESAISSKKKIRTTDDLVQKSSHFDLWRDFQFTKTCISNVFC